MSSEEGIKVVRGTGIILGVLVFAAFILGFGYLVGFADPALPAGSVPATRGDLIGLTLGLAGLAAAIAGVGFAVFAYYNINHAERIVQRRIEGEIQAFRREMARELTAMQEATQKIIAGYNLLERGNTDGAISLFQAAVKVFPAAFNGYTALGYAYLAKDEPLTALDYFRRAVDVFPNRKEPLNDIARLYAQHGTYDMALEYVKEAISVDPTARQDIAEDPVFDGLRNHPELGETFRKLVSADGAGVGPST